MKKLPLFLLMIVSAASVGAAAAQTCPCQEAVEPEALTVEIIDSYPHDSGSFTQGLVYEDGTFYESAGQYGQSDVRQVDIETGDVLRKVEINQQYFAEGLALVPARTGAEGRQLDVLIQLTWRERTAIVWSLESFEPIDSYLYETEGWGLCYDGQHLLMSDGTSNLYVRDADTFQLQAMIPVRQAGEPVLNLNELECVDGVVFANIWQTDTIVRIDPATGAVTGVIDASGLLTADETAALTSGAVLNGIAYNPDAGTFYITGKLWPRVFEVRFVPTNP